MSFLFQTRVVEVETTRWVRTRLRESRGGWIHGPVGSGKSHAVRAAVEGGIHVDVASGPLLGQRFAADLARQVGADGRSLLDAQRREGLSGALEIAERAVNGHSFVVDAAERLLGEPVNLDDPATALWQDDKTALHQWLTDRLERSPTFLVSRRFPGRDQPGCRHRTPETWTIKLEKTPDGFRDWELLGSLGHSNPAIFVLARALVPLMPAAAFNDILEFVRDAAEDDGAGMVGTLFQQLARAFHGSAPKSWQRALALLAALGEVPRDALDPVLDCTSEAGAGVESRSALRRLEELGLVEQRAGRLSVLPALVTAEAVRPLTDQERSLILPAVAHRLLAPVNDVLSLTPSDADRVLLAHSIFVMLGSVGDAERTAALHVHGLVDLARRASLNDEYPGAFRQYDGILRMLSGAEFGVTSRAGQRMLSYVRHYRAYNGSRAGIVDEAACLLEYEQSVRGWPENALWHQRRIQTLVRLGRLVEARLAVVEASAHVEEHPRRDELLRVRPAFTALAAGALLFSLEMIEPLLDAPADLYPEVADGRAELLRRWDHGLAISELPIQSADAASVAGQVEFLRPIEVQVRSTTDGIWVAQLRSFALEGRSETPSRALQQLAARLGNEANRLISTPTSDLSAKDVRLKGRILSIVDALNSDIGLHHRLDRWIVGRIEDGRLVPTLRSLPPVEIPEALMPESTSGVYFARVPIHRDGVPSGPANILKPAGSGFRFSELVEQLAKMNEDAE